MIKKIVLGVIGLVCACSVWAHSGNVYTFGIGPFQSSTELAKLWVPILRHLSSATGYDIQFQTSRDIPSFQSSVVAGAYDFAFVNPYFYLQANASTGYTSIAREKNGTLIGIVLTRKDAAINEMAQLNGLAVAFPASNALAATWLPMNKLKAMGIQVQPHYVNSLESVYLSVARGMFPAGGGEMRTFNALPAETRDQLKIIWRADPLPPFTFAAHPRVPKEVVEKVQAAMADMIAKPETLALLRAVNLAGIEKANDADYNALRKMNITPPANP